MEKADISDTLVAYRGHQRLQDAEIARTGDCCIDIERVAQWQPEYAEYICATDA